MIGALIALGLLLVFWLATLPLWTLVFYWALMHVEKLEELDKESPLPSPRASPQAIRMARRYLLPVGAFNNLVLAWTWGLAHFLTFPGAAGLTKLINRMVEQGDERQVVKALRIRRLYLNHYDHRGEHT